MEIDFEHSTVEKKVRNKYHSRLYTDIPSLYNHVYEWYEFSKIHTNWNQTTNN